MISNINCAQSFLMDVGSIVKVICLTAIGGETGKVIAEAMPGNEWMNYLLGPLGALVAMIAAVWWLTARLKKTEELMRERDLTYIALLEKVTGCVTQNSDMLRRAGEAMESTASAIDHCKAKNQAKP